MPNKTPKAFTLIELLVVIAIIGVLSTLVIVALGNSRASARDAKRLNDLKAMANALELYYADNNEYPSSLTPGDPLEANNIVYMSKVPENPTPRTDGGCLDEEYSYESTGSSYVIYACLGQDLPELSAGPIIYTPLGLSNAYPLNLVSEPSLLALSLRKFSLSYNGPIIRLRKLDNTEQDFYSKGNHLDIEAVKNWIGPENFLRRSEAFDQITNAWLNLPGVGTAITRQANVAESPIGDMTADRLLKTSGSGIRQVLSFGLSLNQAYTFSFWAKADSPITVTADIGDRGVTNFNVTTDWQFFVLKHTQASLFISDFVDLAFPDNVGVYFWGAQLNLGSEVKPYFKTEAYESGLAFVHTWYDQSGNGRNAVQTTANNQPVFFFNSEKGDINFTSTSRFLSVSDFDYNRNHLYLATLARPYINGSGTIISHADGSANRSFLFSFWASLNLVGHITNDGSSYQTSTSTQNYSLNNYQLAEWRYNGEAETTDGQQSAWLNGSSLSMNRSGPSVAELFNSSFSLTIGHNQNCSCPFNGLLREIILFNAYSVSQRDALSSNINRYYSIY